MVENTRIGWGRIPGWNGEEYQDGMGRIPGCDGGEYQDGMGENIMMGWERIPG